MTWKVRPGKGLLISFFGWEVGPARAGSTQRLYLFQCATAVARDSRTTVTRMVPG